MIYICSPQSRPCAAKIGNGDEAPCFSLVGNFRPDAELLFLDDKKFEAELLLCTQKNAVDFGRDLEFSKSNVA